MTAAAKKRSNAPTTIDLQVSARIKTIRALKGMTQGDVAQSLGLVPQQYQKYEAGFLRFSAGLLVRLADTFDCQVQEFFPPTLRGEGEIDIDMRQDTLRQELLSLLMDVSTEGQLIALRTILHGLNGKSASARVA